MLRAPDLRFNIAVSATAALLAATFESTWKHKDAAISLRQSFFVVLLRLK
jgi:hypothetical protein